MGTWTTASLSHAPLDRVQRSSQGGSSAAARKAVYGGNSPYATSLLNEKIVGSKPEKEKDVSVLVFPPPYLGRIPGDSADL